MTMLNQLKSADIARIINFDDVPEIKNKFIFYGISKGDFIRIISSFGLITFNANSKVIVLSAIYCLNLLMFLFPPTEDLITVCSWFK